VALCELVYRCQPTRHHDIRDGNFHHQRCEDTTRSCCHRIIEKSTNSALYKVSLNKHARLRNPITTFRSEKKTEFYTSYCTKHDAVKINATYLKLNHWSIYISELHYPLSTYSTIFKRILRAEAMERSIMTRPFHISLQL
jgi:hypothetical protein